MLKLTLGQSAEEMIVTLNEKRTLDSGYYLFVFTHQTNKTVVNKIYNFTEDDSDYPTRFNSFTIDTSVVFLNKPTGFWNYSIYEQESSSNTVVTGLTEVERGILKLNPATEFAFEKYNPSTSFKAYVS